MIRIDDLCENDIGRWVNFNNGKCNHRKCGTIESWDSKWIYLDIKGKNSGGCNPRYLTFWNNRVCDGLLSANIDKIVGGEELIIIAKICSRVQKIKDYCTEKWEGNKIYVDSMKELKESGKYEDIEDRINLNIHEAEKQMVEFEWILEKCNEVLK